MQSGFFDYHYRCIITRQAGRDRIEALHYGVGIASIERNGLLHVLQHAPPELSML